jgi:hypothetical protein
MPTPPEDYTKLDLISLCDRLRTVRGASRSEYPPELANEAFERLRQARRNGDTETAEAITQAASPSATRPHA